MRQAEAGDEADDGREHAERQRLGEHRAEHLTPLGADHPQQASSRVRCATVIESVLKIVKRATSTATTPNTSSDRSG